VAEWRVGTIIQVALEFSCAKDALVGNYNAVILRRCVIGREPLLIFLLPLCRGSCRGREEEEISGVARGQ